MCWTESTDIQSANGATYVWQCLSSSFYYASIYLQAIVIHTIFDALKDQLAQTVVVHLHLKYFFLHRTHFSTICTSFAYSQPLTHTPTLTHVHLVNILISWQWNMESASTAHSNALCTVECAHANTNMNCSRNLIEALANRNRFNRKNKWDLLDFWRKLNSSSNANAYTMQICCALLLFLIYYFAPNIAFVCEMFLALYIISTERINNSIALTANEMCFCETKKNWNWFALFSRYLSYSYSADWTIQKHQFIASMASMQCYLRARLKKLMWCTIT